MSSDVMYAGLRRYACLVILQSAEMPMEFSIPKKNGHYPIKLDSGTTTTFCGANGSGKTRLAVHIETQLGLAAHRISAHRALSLNPHIAKITEQEALNGLRTGYIENSLPVDSADYRHNYRWGDNEAVSLLNDFDYLVQALFADQARVALQSHRRLRAGGADSAKPTKFEQLSEIWERLIPHRALEFHSDDIKVLIPGTKTTYSASEMSDGERAIFYLIGQTLVASEESVLIVDEPELHLHQSIMAALWDHLATVRPDCAFVFITHSIEFAASRTGVKFVIREFDPEPAWKLDIVPEVTDFSEEFATLILGSRRPVLFVEGAHSSIDRIIYRSAYPDHLVLPLESCEAVIHAVVSMRKTAAQTRISCSGIIDRDHRSYEEVQYLHTIGVEVLPVSEIENIVLLPEVSKAIACNEGYKGGDLAMCLSSLRKAVFKLLESRDEKDAATVRCMRRRIDYFLKRIDLSDAKSIQEIEQCYKIKTGSLNVCDLASEAVVRIQTAIDNNDLDTLLAHYDNKALFTLAAKHLKKTNASSFKGWLQRVLANGSVPQLNKAISNYLPLIPKH